MQTQSITNTEFNGYVSHICRELAKSNWRPDKIVGICRGGSIPAVMISQYFNIPCIMLNVSLRDFTELTCSDLALAEDAYNGEKILIVDDINDSGDTLNWIVNDWQSSCFRDDVSTWESVWNNTVRFAVICDNLTSNFKQGIDYCGFEIDKSKNDVWITFPYERWWI